MILLRKLKWSSARLLFYTYLFFCLTTIIGGYLTGPVFTWYFFNDWRFWLYLRPGTKMFFYGWRFVFVLLGKENHGFMFSVPLASRPESAPNQKEVLLSLNWQNNSRSGCGGCFRCCTVKNAVCPVLDKATNKCLGYNSFFWRYFNCGRYPSTQRELEYYGCPKWSFEKQPDGSL